MVLLFRLLFLVGQPEKAAMAKLLTKIISAPNLFRLEPSNLVSVRFLRGRAPEVARTLNQRLEGKNKGYVVSILCMEK